MKILPAMLITVAAAGAGWWAGGQLQSPEKPQSNAQAMLPVYDHQTAYHLASLGVPPGIKEYFMFDLNPGKNPAEQAAELAKALVTADKEKRPLGLLGDNAEHNLQVIKMAVAQSSGNAFPDAKLIVVGPRHLQQRTRQTAAPLQTGFQYFSYP